MKTNSQSTVKNLFQRYHSIKAETSPEARRNIQSALGELVSNKTDVFYNVLEKNNIKYMWTKSIHYNPSSHKIFYCHGGGYVIGDVSYCKILSSKFSLNTNLEVLSFEYPLAPEKKYPSQLDSAVLALEYLSESADVITVVGESAGGHLAVSVVKKMQETNTTVFNKIKSLVLMSPWVDLTLSAKSYDLNGETDPILSYQSIANFKESFINKDDDINTPYLSPINMNFKGFPKTLIQVGSNEILIDDSISLHQNLKHFGVDSYFSAWKDMWHIFQTFPDGILPAAMEAVNQASEFILY